MIKREAKHTVVFRHWLKENLKHSAVFEIKQTEGSSLPFDSVKQHQIDALLASSNTGLIYKIPDDSRGVKPYDMIFVKDTPAYVVIKYPKSFELITIDTFILEKAKSKRKSLTYDRAKAISVISIDI